MSYSCDLGEYWKTSSPEYQKCQKDPHCKNTKRKGRGHSGVLGQLTTPWHCSRKTCTDYRQQNYCLEKDCLWENNNCTSKSKIELGKYGTPVGLILSVMICIYFIYTLYTDGWDFLYKMFIYS